MEINHEKVIYMLGQIDSKLDAMKEAQDGFSSGLSKLGDRVSTLELFKSNLMGKAVVVMAAGTFLINLIWEAVKEKIKING